MDNNLLLKELRELEIELHHPEVRSSTKRLETLLHDSFVEFGRSGKIYGKAEIIKRLPTEKVPGSVWSRDFNVQKISEGVALLIYKSAYKNESGELSRHTNRSTLWQHTSQGWQMRFHQGTATDEFETNAT